MLFGAGLDGSFELDHDYVAGKRFASGDAVVLDAISIWRVYYADMAQLDRAWYPADRDREPPRGGSFFATNCSSKSIFFMAHHHFSDLSLVTWCSCTFGVSGIRISPNSRLKRYL